MRPVRVAVIDEHEIFRRGLVTCLSDDPTLDVAVDLASGPLESDVDVAVVSPASAATRAAAAGLRIDEGRSGRVHPGRLDHRRLEVLRLLADGADTQQISQQLRYAERTIKGLIQDIERELGARSRAQAVARGIREGLI